MRTIWIMPGWVGIVMGAPRFIDLAETVSTWWDRYLQRCALSELPPHMLKDIGINEVQRRNEVRKPFWVQ